MFKKFYLILPLVGSLFFPLASEAQMTDTLGALAIDGMLSGEAAQGAAQMQNALNKVRFQQDLTELNIKIQTTFLSNYSGLSKEYLDFAGFKDINWQVGSTSPREYYVEFSGIDNAMCEYIRLNNDAKRIEINGAKQCSGNNRLKLFY